MPDERIAKYEAWIREVESRQRHLAATRDRWITSFVALGLASLIGFAWGPWIGGATLFTGVLMAAFGIYTVLVREGDYQREIAHARREVERLRGGG